MQKQRYQNDSHQQQFKEQTQQPNLTKEIAHTDETLNHFIQFSQENLKNMQLTQEINSKDTQESVRNLET